VLIGDYIPGCFSAAASFFRDRHAFIQAAFLMRYCALCLFLDWRNCARQRSGFNLRRSVALSRAHGGHHQFS
jgi:hypothetical protein